MSFRRQEMNKPIGTIGTVVIGALLAACADPPSTESRFGVEPSPSIIDDVGPEPYWDNVLVGGVDMPTADEAAAFLSFSPLIPSGLGSPEKVVVVSSAEGDASGAVAMRFTTDEHGMFWLVQQPSQTSQQELEALASTCDPAEGCQGTWSLAQLDDGTVALRIVGPTAASMVWLQDSIRFELIGPPESFGLGHAKDVADALMKS